MENILLPYLRNRKKYGYILFIIGEIFSETIFQVFVSKIPRIISRIYYNRFYNKYYLPLFSTRFFPGILSEYITNFGEEKRGRFSKPGKISFLFWFLILVPEYEYNFHNPFSKNTSKNFFRPRLRLGPGFFSGCKVVLGIYSTTLLTKYLKIMIKWFLFFL